MNKGDYCIGALWSDGSPNDPWCIGFYNGMNERSNRHSIVDADGKELRFGGFRRVEPIKKSAGEAMLANVRNVERLSQHSVFDVAAMTTKKIKELLTDE